MASAPPRGFTLEVLARRFGCDLHANGHEQTLITGVCPLAEGRQQALAFLGDARFRQYLADTRAGAVVLAPEDVVHCPVPALVTSHPQRVYTRIAALFDDRPRAVAGVHPSAVVSPGARVHHSVSVGAHSVIEDDVTLAAGVEIGPGCVVGAGASIGPDSCLRAHVTVCHGVTIGARALIHPGAVIGGDGFGLVADEQGRWQRIPQLGSVVIGDDVDIGCQTTIDRGTQADTVVADGVKIDNQVQLGHNGYVGEHTVIAGCVGIAGSVHIGCRCLIGGGAGIGDHVRIADEVTVTGMAMITRSVPEAGIYASGTGLQPVRQWRRSVARWRQLDELAQRLRRLEEASGGRGAQPRGPEKK